MKRRNPSTTQDEPASGPAVVTPVRSDWSDWSQAYERQRIEHNVRVTQEAIEKPIIPRELADRIAADYARLAFPDWRLLKQESRGLLTQLVRQQPEMKQPEVKRRGELLNLLREALPRHMRPLLADFELIADLLTDAREAGAFMVGYAMGKRAERVHLDAKGRLTKGYHPAPPASRGLRLHDAGEEGQR